MHNNRNYPQGQKKNRRKSPPKKQRTKVLIFIANNIGEMASFDDDFENRAELVQILKKVYLMSDWADDMEERRSMLHFFEELEELFEGLNQFSKEDFMEMNRWIIQKLQKAA